MTNALPRKEAELFREMAGYQNQMVHFYYDITPEELRNICLHYVADTKHVLDRLVQWTEKYRVPRR